MHFGRLYLKSLRKLHETASSDESRPGYAMCCSMDAHGVETYNPAEARKRAKLRRKRAKRKGGPS